MPDENVTPTVSMPQSLLDEVDHWATVKGWNRSFLVREAIREYMFELKMRAARHEAETAVRATN